MMFWDSSAIIPLCIDEPRTKIIQDIVNKDGSMVVWWGSSIECFSAFARLRRDNILSVSEEEQIRQIILMLSTSWSEIEPSHEIRDIAARLLRVHPLRAADSLQLTAALVWAGKNPKGHRFVCLDKRLRSAAMKEGFILLPTDEYVCV
jgi:predicted nucleic acid-binding protein